MRDQLAFVVIWAKNIPSFHQLDLSDQVKKSPQYRVLFLCPEALILQYAHILYAENECNDYNCNSFIPYKYRILFHG